MKIFLVYYAASVRSGVRDYGVLLTATDTGRALEIANGHLRKTNRLFRNGDSPWNIPTVIDNGDTNKEAIEGILLAGSIIDQVFPILAEGV